MKIQLDMTTIVFCLFIIQAGCDRTDPIPTLTDNSSHSNSEKKIMDAELEGIWQIQSEISDGAETHPEPWFYLFRDGYHKEIIPELVETGRLRSYYEVDTSTRPHRMKITLDYNGPNGPPDPNPKTILAVYDISGNKLRITYGIDDDYPTELTDAFPFSIKTLARHHGPVPESKQPSDTPPLIHDRLGTMIWDDNLGSYEGQILFGGRKVSLSINPKSSNAYEAVLQRALTVVSSEDHYSKLMADYAVQGLLDLKNDSWRNQGEPVFTSQKFIQSISLEAIDIFEGRVEFWYDDGGLFRGHSIQVVIDQNDRCTLTDIPG